MDLVAWDVCFTDKMGLTHMVLVLDVGCVERVLSITCTISRTASALIYYVTSGLVLLPYIYGNCRYYLDLLIDYVYRFIMLATMCCASTTINREVSNAHYPNAYSGRCNRRFSLQQTFCAEMV